MLKKVLIVLMVLLVCCGIGYVGYLIFMARNIDSIALQGSMQTIYFVGDDIDYEDAELKVTYKNGDVKTIKLSDADVSLTSFSTSADGRKKLKITYKNCSPIEVQYDVFKKMLYYVDSETVRFAGNSGEKVTYGTHNTKQAISFFAGGKLRYYHRDGSGDAWLMNDGLYDSDYNYTIVGDKIIVNLGDEKIELSADYSDDKLFLKSSDQSRDSVNPDIISRVVDRTYAEQAMAKRTISSIEMDYSKSQSSNNYLNFKVSETDSIESASFKAYLHVTYNSVLFLKDVYVEICDEMISGTHKLKTSKEMSGITWFEVFYGDPDADGKTLDEKVFYTVSK